MNQSSLFPCVSIITAVSILHKNNTEGGGGEGGGGRKKEEKTENKQTKMKTKQTDQNKNPKHALVKAEAVYVTTLSNSDSHKNIEYFLCVLNTCCMHTLFG